MHQCGFEYYTVSFPLPPQSAVLCGLNNMQSLTSDSLSVLSALSVQNTAVVAIYNPMEFERSHNTRSLVHENAL